MHKRISFLMLICLLSFFFVRLSVFSIQAAPGIFRVPESYSTIQQAIDASEVGSTIEVASGKYVENVTIWKSLSLVGAGRDTTFLGSTLAFAVVRITASNVVFSGFTVQNASIGVWIDGSHGNTVKDSRIVDNDDGVWVTLSYGNILSSNVITNNVFFGIYVKDSNSTTSSQNTVANNTYGIYMENCRSGKVSENKVGLNYVDGVSAYGVNDTRIVRNTIYNNTVGVYLEGSINNSIYQNNFLNNANQTLFLDSMNDTWDNGFDGNYWNDYNGTDTNGDKIGDTELPWQGVDYLPLMTPYLKADMNYDSIVNILDLVRVAWAFGATPTSPRWNPRYDITEDNIVNILDLVKTAANFGKKWQPP